MQSRYIMHMEHLRIAVLTVSGCSKTYCSTTRENGLSFSSMSLHPQKYNLYFLLRYV